MFGCLGEDADALSGRGVAHRTFGLLRLADLTGAVHAEQVVTAGDQRGSHLALEAHEAVPVSPARHDGAQGARFETAQHAGAGTHAAAAFGVGGRAAGQRGGRAGRISGGAAAAAAATAARERRSCVQPGERT